MKQMKNNKKLKWIILSALVLILAAGGIVGAVYGIPAYRNSQAYQSAEKLLQDGQYEEAKSEFWALGGYKDSADKIKECDYQKAKKYLQDKQFDEAKELFKELGDYSDSNQQINACEYGRAEDYLTKKEYDAAQTIFEKLGEYEDSAEKIKACQYGKAEDYLAKKEYDEAQTIFKKLGKYEDSAKKVKACQYGKAEAYLSEKDYENAKKIYKKLGKYKDSAEKIKVCQYALAENLMNNSEYSKAKAIYKELGDYKDSKKKLEQCQIVAEKANARKAYRELLENNEYSDYNIEHSDDMLYYDFFLCDINKDGIEELIIGTSSGAEWGGCIFTYKNGKVKKVIEGNYRTYYAVYKNAGIIKESVSPGGAEIYTYYAVSKDGTAVEKAGYSETANYSDEYEEMITDYIYTIEKKSVGEEEYNRYMDNLIGSEEEADSYVENTEENRNSVFGY